MHTWTKEYARSYMVNYHNINTATTMTIYDVFDRIHFIQYDPLNVVGSNSELVLQSRVKHFKKIDLQNALYKDRTVIDGWDKQMGIYQTSYFPLYERVREYRMISGMISYGKHSKIDAVAYQERILDIIKTQGPIFSSSIKLGEPSENRWGLKKPSTTSLDYLFHMGVIGIHSRKNTQKRYDLNENLIPTFMTKDPFNDDEAFIEWYLQRRIEAMGLVSNKSGVHLSGPFIYSKKLRTEYINRLIQKGSIQEVMIEGISEIFYIPTNGLLYNIELKDTISFIAPLDNLIWDRNLVQTLFDFEYRWEVYTPKVKRVYGYYVLPILRGSSFIGRIEFRKQRKDEPLEIINIFYEPHIKQTKILDKKLNQALKKFARYLDTTYQTK
jgi:hypothetical protein